MLTAAPAIRSVTIFEELQRRYRQLPAACAGRWSGGPASRNKHGPEKNAIFHYVCKSGRKGLSDFTDIGDLGPVSPVSVTSRCKCLNLRP